MLHGNLSAMPIEDLWELHEKIRVILEQKMIEQRRALDQRIRLLNPRNLSKPQPAVAVKAESNQSGKFFRRPYPEVKPLYRNPDEPTETWSGRGNKPRWLAAKIKAGKSASDFLITAQPGPARRARDRKRP